MIRNFLSHLLTVNLVFLVIPLAIITSFRLSYTTEEITDIFTKTIYQQIAQKTTENLNIPGLENLPAIPNLEEITGSLGQEFDSGILETYIQEYKEQILQADLSNGELNLQLPTNLLSTQNLAELGNTTEYKLKVPFKFSGTVSEALSKAISVAKTGYILAIIITTLLLFLVVGTSLKHLISHLSSTFLVIGGILLVISITFSLVPFLKNISELTPVYKNLYLISSITILLSVAGLLFSHMPKKQPSTPSL